MGLTKSHGASSRQLRAFAAPPKDDTLPEMVSFFFHVPNFPSSLLRLSPHPQGLIRAMGRCIFHHPWLPSSISPRNISPIIHKQVVFSFFFFLRVMNVEYSELKRSRATCKGRRKKSLTNSCLDSRRLRVGSHLVTFA